MIADSENGNGGKWFSLSQRSQRGIAAIKCHCVSHRARRDHGGLEFLSRIVERTIRLKLTWVCSEKRGVGLISSLKKSDQGYLLSDLPAWR